jgi:NAD(P)-dependent dehydrogenase (short-subunit alcohol dehydrogenase family)
MSRWTGRDIPDQTGRTAIVTGANSGIGFHTAMELSRAGARVVLTSRDEAKGQEAVRRIEAEVPRAQVELGVLDLADLGSVRRFAEAFAGVGALDVLVNNAGVMAVPQRRTTADGLELQLGTNHLGHFALTGLLLPALLTRQGSRVVTVSSTAHRMGRMRFDDLQGERGYRPWRAYGQSKLANLLFAFELDRRASSAGLDLLSAAAHPGLAATNLQTAGPRLGRFDLSARIGAGIVRPFRQPAERGALPSLYAATAPEVVGGGFYGPDGPGQARGYPTPVAPSRRALEEEVARRLWEVSEELTGVDFDLVGPAADADVA